jgi:hypothetical protein
LYFRILYHAEIIVIHVFTGIVVIVFL